MALVARRHESETWRQMVSRIAGQHHLRHECLDAYDQLMQSDPSRSEEDAAFAALYEWDCLEFEAPEEEK